MVAAAVGKASCSVHEPILQMGLDSLGAMELRGSLASWMPEVELPLTLVFDYPSACSIAEYIWVAMQGGGVSGDELTEVRAAGVGYRGEDSFHLSLLVGLGRLGSGADGKRHVEEDSPCPAPESRWDADLSTGGRNSAAAASAERFGSWVADVAAFDAARFGVRGVEAAGMAPQHRLLLHATEESWVALSGGGKISRTMIRITALCRKII